jgi:hypothetical protein
MDILADSQPAASLCAVFPSITGSAASFLIQILLRPLEYLQLIVVSSIVDPVKIEDASSLPLPMGEVRPEYE